MFNAVLQARVPKHFIQPVRAEANARDISVSELIREALAKELERRGDSK